MSQQFQTHTIQKQYLAIALGSLDRSIEITDNIDAKAAYTHVSSDPKRTTVV